MYRHIRTSDTLDFLGRVGVGVRVGVVECQLIHYRKRETLGASYRCYLAAISTNVQTTAQPSFTLNQGRVG